MQPDQLEGSREPRELLPPHSRARICGAAYMDTQAACPLRVS